MESDIGELENGSMSVVNQFNDILGCCVSAVKLENLIQSVIKDAIFCDYMCGKDASMVTPHLLVAEKNLLTLSSYPDCTDGIIYALPLVFDVNDEKYLYVRYFETGIFKGFSKSVGLDLIKTALSHITFKESILISVYNDWDVTAARCHRLSDKRGKGTSKNSYVFHMITQGNKTALNLSFPLAHATFKKSFSTNSPGYIVFCRRNASNCRVKDPRDSRYFKVDGLGSPEDWDTSLKSFILQSVKDPCNIETVVRHCAEKSVLNLQEKFNVLSAIPNFHRWESKKNHGVKKEDYFIDNGTSPRNKIMRIMLNLLEITEDDFDVVGELKMQRLNLLHLVFTDNQYKRPESQVVSRKKRKIIKKIKPKLTVAKILECLDISETVFNTLTEQTDMNNGSLFEQFKDNIITHGTLKWRVLGNGHHEVVMNNYDSESGAFKFSDYVHVSKHVNNTDDVVWNCTCDTFRVLMSTVQGTYGEYSWEGVQCLHCRYIEEILVKNNIYQYEVSSDHDYLNNGDKVVTADPLKAAVNAKNFPVIKLPSMLNDVRKFSVVCDRDVEFVHIFRSEYNSQVYVNCSSGLCQHSFGKKKKLQALRDSPNICRHLVTFRENSDEIGAFEGFTNNDDCDDDGIDGVDETESVEDGDSDLADNVFTVEDEEGGVENIDDIPASSSLGMEEKMWADCFDPTTGMWLFKSRFGHVVTQDPYDENLVEHCRKRDILAATYLEGAETFCASFYPSCIEDVCQCGLYWTRGENGELVYAFDSLTTLYTSITPLSCKTYKLICSSGTCIVRWNGISESVFRISPQVAAGYEICWDFVDLVTKVKCNFAAYCDIMNSRYKRRNPLSNCRFMSAKTFRKLFFSWASHQQIDFRSPCSWCGYSPKVLAADATKIGVAMKNVNIDPVERTVNSELELTIHRKFDRCFLSYPPRNANISTEERKNLESVIRECRKHMKLIMSTSKGFLSQPSLISEQLEARNTVLLTNFPQPCKRLLERLFLLEISEEQRHAATSLFYILSFDAPLRSVVPSPLLSVMDELLDNCENNASSDPQVFIEVCSLYNKRLGIFVNSFNENGVLDVDALSVLRYISQRIKETRQNDPPAPDCSPISPYNPPKYGRAYYFTKEGGQIRYARKFTIDEQGSKRNHDDASTTSKCSKYYPVVALKGTCFMFLWFCPSHGHCYGFHIVNGSEGRKDAANSLLTHLPAAPSTIFYDFSCSLEEYCMNREGGYYGETRFFHDIFHGYSHACSPAYSSKELDGFRGVNTSICEQFNSFLQCIKSSAKHMSQTHFMFFTQYMIGIWNKKKKNAFEKKLRVAASGAF